MGMRQPPFIDGRYAITAMDVDCLGLLGYIQVVVRCIQRVVERFRMGEGVKN